MDVNSTSVVYKAVPTIPDQRIDKDRLDFHLIHNDYFGVQATALGFIEEWLLQCEAKIGMSGYSQELALLRQLRAEAIYLHQNLYTVNPSDTV